MAPVRKGGDEPTLPVPYTTAIPDLSFTHKLRHQVAPQDGLKSSVIEVRTADMLRFQPARVAE